MSMSSQVYFGYFIKAKRATAPQLDTDFLCTKDHDHEYGHPTPKFCPECGSPVDLIKHTIEVPMSMWDLQCDDEQDWIKQLAEEDVAWINEMFSCAPNFSIGEDEDHDFIMCKGYEDVDGLEPGVHQMSISDIATPPTLADIKRLQKLMCYETTELSFGALVSISS